MRLYLNELSLSRQFNSPSEFIGELEKLLSLRETDQVVANRLFCSRDIHLRPVTGNHSFQEAVSRSGDKNLVRRVLGWLTKSGPFWDEQRQFNADDYFELANADVTDTALGEAARIVLSGNNSNMVSFQRGGFDYRPISIQHGLAEDVLGHINLDNEWDFVRLKHIILDAAPWPVNWHQMLEQAINRFEYLRFSPLSIASLEGEPFSSYVVERVFELSKVLNEYVGIINLNGGSTDRSNELLSQHFGGEKSWFSDESDTNKDKFFERMRFNDIDGGGKISCTWHGKIKTPQYRVHFKWPISQGELLQIYYIGPKLTKV